MIYAPEVKDAMIRDFATYIGMQIRLRRTELGLSQNDVVAQTGITQSQLSKIERGEADIKLSTLAILRSALALKITVEKL